MLVIRLLLALSGISVLVSVAIFILTKDRRYLRFSWQIIKFTGVLCFVAAVLFAVGRIILF